jgi:hypothetical protein
MIDLSEERHAPSLPANIPPPPDDTLREKQQAIARISPHRMKRIRELLASGRDPGSISRMLSIPSSTIAMIRDAPEKVEGMRNDPMSLGDTPNLGGSGGLGESRSYSPGLLETLGL